METNWNNEKGLTLVELLAVSAIMVLIITMATPILLNTLRTSESVQKETLLRDEADLLMASVIRELYTTKESAIIERNFPKKNTENYYIVTRNNKKTGFINNELLVADRTIKLTNDNITLLPSTIYKIDDGQYEITLRLRMKGKKPVEKDFVNVVNSIDNIQKEGDDDE